MLYHGHTWNFELFFFFLKLEGGEGSSVKLWFSVVPRVHSSSSEYLVVATGFTMTKCTCVCLHGTALVLCVVEQGKQTQHGKIPPMK